MKDIGAADLWDKIIDRCCSKEEKEILSKLSEDKYSLLEEDYEHLIDNIQRVIDSQSKHKLKKE